MNLRASRRNQVDCELKVLDEHERMLLVGADRDAFLAAVMESPEPAEKLMAALKRHREIMG